MYQQQKRYNMATDKFSNFKLGMVWLGRPQAAMYSQFPRFLVINSSLKWDGHIKTTKFLISEETSVEDLGCTYSLLYTPTGNNATDGGGGDVSPM